MLERRTFLKGALGGLLAVSAHGCTRNERDEVRYDPAAFPRPARSRVAVLRAGAYDRPLETAIRTELPVGIASAGELEGSAAAQLRLRREDEERLLPRDSLRTAQAFFDSMT